MVNIQEVFRNTFGSIRSILGEKMLTRTSSTKVWKKGLPCPVMQKMLLKLNPKMTIPEVKVGNIKFVGLIKKFLHQNGILRKCFWGHLRGHFWGQNRRFRIKKSMISEHPQNVRGTFWRHFSDVWEVFRRCFEDVPESNPLILVANPTF